MWLACSPESSTLYLFVSGRLWSGAPVTGSEKSWEWGTERVMSLSLESSSATEPC